MPQPRPPQPIHLPAPRGRPFAKGNAGRKPGSKNRITVVAGALLDGATEDLVRKAVEIAKAGDVPMLKFLLGRILPRERPIKLDLPPMNRPHRFGKSPHSRTASVASREISSVLTTGETRRYILWSPLGCLGSFAATSFYGSFRFTCYFHRTLARNAEANARPGVIEKFNSQGFQSQLHIADSDCATGDRFSSPCFHVSDRVHVEPSRIRHLLLVNPRQRTRGL